jgi:hypothetical protein
MHPRVGVTEWIPGSIRLKSFDDINVERCLRSRGLFERVSTVVDGLREQGGKLFPDGKRTQSIRQDSFRHNKIDGGVSH